jgi:hypothetical protein
VLSSLLFYRFVLFTSIIFHSNVNVTVAAHAIRFLLITLSCFTLNLMAQYEDLAVPSGDSGRLASSRVSSFWDLWDPEARAEVVKSPRCTPTPHFLEPGRRLLLRPEKEAFKDEEAIYKQSLVDRSAYDVGKCLEKFARGEKYEGVGELVVEIDTRKVPLASGSDSCVYFRVGDAVSILRLSVPAVC